MQESDPPHLRSRSFREQLLDALHCALAVYAVVLVIGTLLGGLDQLGAPGAPVILFWITIATGIILAAAILPAMFRRLPQKAQAAVQLGIIAFVALPITTIILLQNAWENTPQGAAQAQQFQAQQEREAADEERKTEAAARLAQLQQAQQEATDRQNKLETCFTTFGHRLPKLEEEVKDRLGNPRSFEQVATVAMVSDADGYNVLLRFRAQNRMGALWTFGIRAVVDPETCSITNVEAEPSES